MLCRCLSPEFGLISRQIEDGVHTKPVVISCEHAALLIYHPHSIFDKHRETIHKYIDDDSVKDVCPGWSELVGNSRDSSVGFSQYVRPRWLMTNQP